MKIPDPYAELGLASDASAVEVKRAYRRLVSHWHPDRNKSSEALEKMKRINRAYHLLTDGGAQSGDGQHSSWQGRGYGGADPFADAEDFARHFREGFGSGSGRSSRAGHGPGQAWDDAGFRRRLGGRRRAP